jgi:protein-tyrosine phosphatase
MRSVLFVCLGNICRSPLAQGIFEHQIRQAGLAQHFDADSAGTSGWHAGERPHSGSIRIAKKYGISIEKQRSRPVHPKDAEIFDYIIAMDTSNRESLLSEFRFPESKIFLMRSFSRSGSSSHNLNVPDPWGMGDEAFENVYRILEDAVAGLVKELISGRLRPPGG